MQRPRSQPLMTVWAQGSATATTGNREPGAPVLELRC